jgi:hypothetical protein
LTTAHQPFKEQNSSKECLTTQFLPEENTMIANEFYLSSGERLTIYFDNQIKPILREG